MLYTWNESQLGPLRVFQSESASLIHDIVVECKSSARTCQCSNAVVFRRCGSREYWKSIESMCPYGDDLIILGWYCFDISYIPAALGLGFAPVTFAPFQVLIRSCLGSPCTRRSQAFDDKAHNWPRGAWLKREKIRKTQLAIPWLSRAAFLVGSSICTLLATRL